MAKTMRSGGPWLLMASIAIGALTAQRQRMNDRPRRIIYNNDCDVYAHASATSAGFLAQRMDATLGSQVDSVFYCTGATVTNVELHVEYRSKNR